MQVHAFTLRWFLNLKNQRRPGHDDQRYDNIDPD